MPHPAIFAFHKLIVAKIRKNKDKGAKDKEEAVRILRALIAKGELALTMRLLHCMLPKWRIKVLASLKETNAPEILGALNGD
ncbi:MAG: hypothetical protein PHH68_01910 [Candidatus Omnitrophica bacterium]|nr:hypothetical protein [Candidatus Omnitrophota bacterium]